MTGRRHQQIAEIFRLVCDLEGDELARVLEKACSGDARLRDEVEALLARDKNLDDAFGEAQLGVGRGFLALDPATAETTAPNAVDRDAASQGRFLPGTMIGPRYRVVSLIGRGGMGEVYRADDLKLGQAVALKFLPSDLTQSPRLLELLRNEARLSRQLAHRNVCRVHDLGEVDGQHFLSMEYVDGEDLERLLRRIGRLPRDKGIDIARQIARGLAAAHGRGVLHRDLKPANILIDGHGQVRITDFGMARPVDAPGRPGEISGTLAYMAPEQLARGETTVRSDLYSMGLVLYEMFTGQAGHRTRTASDLGRPTTAALLRPPSAIIPDMDPDVERVVLACLDPDPGQRPASARAVVAALPGGEPLELAIAAGDTPSPEMVGAAGENQRLSWRRGLAYLAGALIGVLVSGWLMKEAQEHVEFRATGLVRPDFARKMIRRLGLESAAADATFGLQWSEPYFEQFADDADLRQEWTQLTGGPPTAATFWYRQSPDDLVPLQGRGPFLGMLVTRDDPPPHFAGTVSLLLDADGRLLELIAPPASVRNPAAGASTARLGTRLDAKLGARSGTLLGTQLLEAAGIPPARFEREFMSSREERVPPIAYADRWASWISRSGRLRIEVAACGERPVFFRIAPEAAEAATPPVRWLGIILSLTVLALFGTSLVLARRNWLSGRADRRGATRLLVFSVVTSLASWALQAHHVAGVGEFGMILETGARALLRAVFLCAAYVGVEPHVRKLWPRTLVGWNRLLAGRLHDPAIGRDVLVGLVGGGCLQLLGSIGLVAGFGRQLALTADPAVRLGLGPLALEPLLGAHVALGLLFQEALVGVVGGLVVCLLFVFGLRAVLRRTSLAVVAFVLFFATPTIIRGDVLGAIVVSLWASMGLLLLFRFGVLTVAVAWVTWRLLSWPVDFDVSAPHLDLGVLARSGLAALACYAFFLATGRRQSGVVDLDRLSSSAASTGGT